VPKPCADGADLLGTLGHAGSELQYCLLDARGIRLGRGTLGELVGYHDIGERDDALRIPLGFGTIGCLRPGARWRLGQTGMYAFYWYFDLLVFRRARPKPRSRLTSAAILPRWRLRRKMAATAVPRVIQSLRADMAKALLSHSA
jgi:hypothetical protein